MKELLPASMITLAILIAAWILRPLPVKTPLPAEPYEIIHTTSCDYLLDRAGGAVWRYYRNNDSNGLPETEGFTVLKPASKFTPPWQDYPKQKTNP